MTKNPIINALVWAGLMIAVSLMTKDHENSSAILLMMIGGWIATGGLSSETRKAECAMFKRMLGRS